MIGFKFLRSFLSLSKILLKAELWITDFKHFYWLDGHRQSVHVPTVTIMVKESFSNKASWKHSCHAEKKWPKKVVLGWNKTNVEE